MESGFRVGPWLVEPRLNTISLSGRETRVEPKVVEVLVCMARHAGDVVSRERLIEEVWGDTFVSDAALTRCIAELRKVFDDDVREPRVIQTIAKQGYRLIAPVSEARDEAPRPEAAPRRESRRAMRFWLAAATIGGAAGIAAGAAVIWLYQPRPRAAPVLRFSIPLRSRPLAGSGGFALALSREGNRLAYCLRNESGRTMLYVRALDSLDAVPVPGTEGGASPFFSPDGAWLGFAAGGKLEKVPVTGGTPVVLCDALDRLGGASWADDGWIVFCDGRGLMRVRESGGAPEVVASLGPGESYGYPSVLPGDTHVLFSVVGAGDRSEVAVVPLAGGARKTLVHDVVCAWPSAGYLVYYGSGRLTAVGFDPRRLAVRGEPVPLVPGEGFSAVSHSGTLVVTRFPQSEFRLAWVGRDGTSEFLPLDPGFYHQPALSPDGRRIAVEFGMDVWIYSLDRGTFNRLTFGDSGYWPIWTPDGRYVVYTSPRWRGSPDGGDLFRKRADGSGPEERLTTTELEHSPMSFTPDGKTLVFCVYSPTTGGSDLWRFRLDGDRKPEPLLRTRFNEGSAMVSPDGRWLAYHSDESGQLEVYVVSFPEPSSKWRVSNAGGFQPLWSRDGGELFYRSDDGTLFAVPVETDPVFSVAGKPRSLFKRNFRRGGRTNYAVTPDGKRFLICELLPESSDAQFQVVVNFLTELQGRARTVK